MCKVSSSNAMQATQKGQISFPNTTKKKSILIYVFVFFISNMCLYAHEILYMYIVQIYVYIFFQIFLGVEIVFFLKKGLRGAWPPYALFAYFFLEENPIRTQVFFF